MGSNPTPTASWKKKGLAQDDLTKKVESGTVNKPSVQTMAKIAKALDVSIEDLLK